MQDNQAGAVKSEVENSKKNTGMIAGMVALAVIALGGVGFGIGQTISANNQLAAKDSEIASLKVKTTSPNGTKTEMEAETVTVTSPDGTVTEIAETPAVNTEDYIYIGEWGMKIKIPKELSYVSYIYDNHGSYGGSSVLMAGALNGTASKPSFTDIRKYDGLGAISRYPTGTERPYSTFVFSDGDYDYYYDGANGMLEDSADWDLDLLNKSYDLIHQILANPENYSRI